MYFHHLIIFSFAVIDFCNTVWNNFDREHQYTFHRKRDLSNEKKKIIISWLRVSNHNFKRSNVYFVPTVNPQILCVCACMRIYSLRTVSARCYRPKIDSNDSQNENRGSKFKYNRGNIWRKRGFFEYEKQIKLTKRILFIIIARDIFFT